MATRKGKGKSNKKGGKSMTEDPVSFLTRDTTKFNVGLRNLDTKGAPCYTMKVPGLTFLAVSTGANAIAIARDTSVSTNMLNFATKLGAVFAEYAIVGIIWFVQAIGESDNSAAPIAGSVAFYVDEQINTTPTATLTNGRRRMVLSVDANNSTSCGKISWKPHDFADLTFQLNTTVAFSPAYLKIYGDATSYGLQCATTTALYRISCEYSIVFRNFI